MKTTKDEWKAASQQCAGPVRVARSLASISRNFFRFRLSSIRRNQNSPVYSHCASRPYQELALTLTVSPTVSRISSCAVSCNVTRFSWVESRKQASLETHFEFRRIYWVTEWRIFLYKHVSVSRPHNTSPVWVRY